MALAWGQCVPEEFRDKVMHIAQDLAIDPNHLMACMAFETGRTFNPAITNGAGSGAVGLIQFMPQTAGMLGTTTGQLSRMGSVQQLSYVHKYFQPYRNRLKTLEDVYMAILWPAAVGKPDNYVLFDKRDIKHPKRYLQNAGLDFNRDGLVVKKEACARVRSLLSMGLSSQYVTV